jgi:hypothetical protein
MILFPLFATGVIDTGGKFAAVHTVGKLPLVSLTPVANLPPVTLTLVTNLPPVSITIAKLVANFPPVSLIPVVTLTCEYLREFSKTFFSVKLQHAKGKNV